VAVDQSVCLTIELEKRPEELLEEAIGLDTYSNSGSNVFAYSSIFENLWKQAKSMRHIVVSEHNYFALKRLGYAGDSFNVVISKLRRMKKNYQEMKKQQQEEEQQENNVKNSSNSGFISPPSHSVMFAEQNKQQIAELVQLLRVRKGGRARKIKPSSKKVIAQQRRHRSNFPSTFFKFEFAITSVIMHSSSSI